MTLECCTKEQVCLLGEKNATDKLEKAIADVIAEGKNLIYDLKPDNPVGTSQVADAIIGKLGNE